MSAADLNFNGKFPKIAHKLSYRTKSKSWISRYPDFRTSGYPDFRIYGYTDIQLSGFPAIRISGFPNIRIAGCSDIRAPGHPVSLIPGCSTVRRFEYPGVRIIQFVDMLLPAPQFKADADTCSFVQTSFSRAADINRSARGAAQHY